jgi:hypothetical protein
MSKKKKKKEEIRSKFWRISLTSPNQLFNKYFHIEIWAKISKNYPNLQFKNKILQNISPISL